MHTRDTLVFLAALGLAAASPAANAQELTLAAGATRTMEPRDTSYALLAAYSHALAPHLSASYSYRNEGHVPSHHRDGHAVQVWLTTHDGDGFALGAGVGPYRYFDTEVAENTAGFANAHGWAALYSVAATWRAPGGRWTWELRVEHIEAHDSFDTTLAMLGASYRLSQDGTFASNAAPRARDHELSFLAGQTIVNSFESQGARAYLVEARAALAPAVRVSAAFINEGNARLVRRKGVVAQLWLEPSFSGDAFTIGVGAGPYVAEEPGGGGWHVLGLVGVTTSWHFAPAWSARISWNRVSSNYDRDSDILAAGISYRF